MEHYVLNGVFRKIIEKKTGDRDGFPLPSDCGWSLFLNAIMETRSCEKLETTTGTNTRKICKGRLLKDIERELLLVPIDPACLFPPFFYRKEKIFHGTLTMN